MNHKIQSCLIILGLLLAVSSCTSLSDSLLLSNDVASKYKAEALVSAGKDLYKDKLVNQGDISASAEVQRYFEAAIRFDPENTEAVRYLAIVQDLKDNRFASSIKLANSLIAKEKRSQEDDYSMLKAINIANSIYPQDSSAIKLLTASSSIRKAYTSARLSEAEAAKAKLSPETKEAEKERILIAAFNLVLKARDVDPKDGKIKSGYESLKKDIALIVKKRLESINSLISKVYFTEAKNSLALLKDLDKKIGFEFSSELQSAEYNLYLSWAKYYETQKEWAKANAQIKTALAIKPGSEASALQKRVATAAEIEERGASFEAGLKNLDSYISKNDLIRAQKLLASLSKTADEKQRALLNKRRQAITDALPSIYQEGVKAYKEERFKDAIASLEIVFSVSPSYQETADYLDKARAKQKLLDQY